MKSGYRVFWTDHALDELRNTVEYLELNFTDREIRNLSEKIESTLRLVSVNPNIFPEIEESVDIRRVVIARFNTMYYRVNNNQSRYYLSFPIGKLPKRDGFDTCFPAFPLPNSAS